MHHVRDQEFDSIVTRFRSHLEKHPERIALRHLETGDHDGPARVWDYATLDERARAVAALLGDRTGDPEPVMLLYPTGLEFAAALLGCFYAGIPAIPASTPDPSRVHRLLPRLLGIIRDSGARIVLTDSATALAARALTPRVPELAALRFSITDSLDPVSRARARKDAPPADALAILQYTSGSTGTPKGVMVTHRNFVANALGLENVFLHTEPARWVGWLPLFHDMGLMANLIQSWWTGGELTLMSPEAFLARPLRWIRALSAFRATRAVGPDFSLALCARKAEGEDLSGIDLGELAVVITGAEPVRAQSLESFARAFEPHGFRREAFAPCYGLAEGTLLVTGPDANVHTNADRFLAHDFEIEHRAHRVRSEEHGTRAVMSCGAPQHGLTVRVVNPKTRRTVADGQVGEIWLRGLSISPGYWHHPDTTEEIFGARIEGDDGGPFVRTGDVGFWLDGQLYPCSRLKDLIVLHGRNLFPNDLEDTMERAHPAIRPGCTVAIEHRSHDPHEAPMSRNEMEEHGDALAVVVELDPRVECSFDAVAEAIRHALAAEHEMTPDLIVFIEPRTLPKTSSGKVQRSQCRADLREGRLQELHRADAHAAPSSSVQGKPETPTEQASQANQRRVA